MSPNISRKSFIAIAGSVAVASLVGCGSGEQAQPESTQPATGTTPQSSDPLPAQITESGYYIDMYGYVMYGIVWTNPNSDYEIQYPALTITGRDADGKIVFSDDQVMDSLAPGEEQRFGCQAGNGTTPATVEFTVSDSNSTYVHSDAQAQAYFTISNPNEVTDSYGDSSFTGEITTDVAPGDSKEAWVSVLLRDANGAIIYGCNTFTDIGGTGETRPFEISAHGDIPAHSSFELDALPWM